MAIYTYIDTQGQSKTVEAPDPNTALKIAPNIRPDSGVMVAQGAQNNNPTTPVSTTGSPQPESSSGAGSLLDFKSALNQVVQLAKEKRNSMSLDFMKPLQGTVAASDFGSILNNLNQASDTFTKDTLKLATPTYKTDQVGGDLYQYQVDSSGKIIGEPVKILSGKTSGEGSKLTHQEKVDAGYEAIDSLIGVDKNGQPVRDEVGVPYTHDNYFTYKGFQKLVEHARANGISRDDFIKQYASKFAPDPNNEYRLTPAEKKMLYGDDREI